MSSSSNLVFRLPEKYQSKSDYLIEEEVFTSYSELIREAIASVDNFEELEEVKSHCECDCSLSLRYRDDGPVKNYVEEAGEHEFSRSEAARSALILFLEEHESLDNIDRSWESSLSPKRGRPAKYEDLSWDDVVDEEVP